MPDLNPVDDVTDAITANVGRLQFYANTFALAGLAAVLFLLGIFLIFNKQIMGAIGGAASVVGPGGKVGAATAAIGALKK